MSNESKAKAHAREVIDSLPDSASWDDVMYELYVRESIDAGLADVAAGRTIPHEQVRARLQRTGAPGVVSLPVHWSALAVEHLTASGDSDR